MAPRLASPLDRLDRLLPPILRTPTGRVVAGLAGLGPVFGGGLLAVELALRAVHERRGGYYRYAPYWRERLEQASLGIPGFPPTSMVEINADGERGDPPPSPGERCYRALVVGGSAAECYHLDQSATWSASLQRILNAPEHLAVLGAPRAHVGNVARAILPVEQTIRMLRKILPRYRRLDTVVVMVGGADVVSWVERGAPAVIAPVDYPLDRLFEQHPERWGVRPPETALWRTLSQWNRRYRQPVVVEPGLSAWLPRVRKMRAEAPHRVDEVPDPTPMLARFEASLRGLLEMLRGAARRVVLVRQPWFGPDPTPEEEAMFWNFGLGRPYKEQVSTYLTPRVVDALMRAMDQRAVEVATAMGVEHVDVGSRIEHTARTFYDELHFTPAGAEVVAHVIAETLVRSPPG